MGTKTNLAYINSRALMKEMQPAPRRRAVPRGPAVQAPYDTDLLLARLKLQQLKERGKNRK